MEVVKRISLALFKLVDFALIMVAVVCLVSGRGIESPYLLLAMIVCYVIRQFIK